MQQVDIKMEKTEEAVEEIILKERYKTRSIKIISFLHVVIGVLAFIAEIIKITATFREDQTLLAMGEGFYCGFIFIITGLVGLLTIITTTSCKVTAFLVLSILSSVFGGWLLAISGCIITGPIIQGHGPAIMIHGVLIMCGLSELILGIVSSSFSCQACCSCCKCKSDVTEVSDNPVVYLTSIGDRDDVKPGIVELNLKEMRKLQKQNGDQTTASLKKDVTTDIPNSIEKMVTKAKGYARFP